ncbi:MAG: glutamine--fructose-6-phosphate transaminase (isomerizing) [Clostridia bacterium]|nr:glutamine--fructose-6-phosphate transaminase (isomerizing) [Clostridia bacterium]
MCGIVGYSGRAAAAPVIYGGLKRLEYRGYDSAGIATLDGGYISVAKKLGKVSSLEGAAAELYGETGIGQTRWATHGKPSDINAHPHALGKFAVVHNGIIENYTELKARYFRDIIFTSRTDSEIIVRLFDKFYSGNLLQTLKEVSSVLKGSYAVLVICADFNGFGVMKYKSPVIVGGGRGEGFAASDAPALAGLCKKISILEDGDFALVSPSGVKIYDNKLNPAARQKIINRATAASLELNGCAHYMQKEISENPSAVENTVKAFSRVQCKLKEAFANINRVIITGCGTAYNSGLVAKRYIESFARIPAEAEIAGEFRYKNPVITSGTAVIAISQSGETADTVEAAKLAKSLGAKVIAVTNAPYSALTLVSDVVVPVAAGHEICVAATKSYTGQIAALYLTAKLLASLDKKSAAKPIRNAKAEICAIVPLLTDTVAHTDIDALAQVCARADGVYFLGRDIDYAVALEGSLKLKEITYIQSEGYPAGELKHGTLALIDENKTAVVIITDENLAVKCENAVEQVLSRKGKVAVITNVAGCAQRLKGEVPVIEIPPCPKELSPLLSAAAVQLLAYKTALILERNPDQPRNLAKSVTVE